MWRGLELGSLEVRLINGPDNVPATLEFEVLAARLLDEFGEVVTDILRAGRRCCCD